MDIRRGWQTAELCQRHPYVVFYLLEVKQNSVVLDFHVLTLPNSGREQLVEKTGEWRRLARGRWN
jgi:hypothetical protein